MLTKNMTRGIAAVAVALMLTACGSNSPDTTDNPTTPAAAETSAADTTEPADDASEPATEPTEPEGSGEEAPQADGDMSGADFAKLIASGMSSVKTIKATSSSEATGETLSYTDLSDPKNPIVYNMTDFMGTKIEVVANTTHSFTRTNEGEWTKTEHDPQVKQAMDEAMKASDPGELANLYGMAKLVDAGERKYEVAVGEGGPAMLMWLDDDNRIVKHEVTVGDISVTTTSEYNVPIEIPEVPGL